MRNTKHKKARFVKNFGQTSPGESGNLVIEATGVIRLSTNIRNRYYFLSVEKCPICNKRHDYQHLNKEDFYHDGILNLFSYEDTRAARCYNEDVFTQDQIKVGYQVPEVHITVDLTSEEQRNIIKTLFKNGEKENDKCAKPYKNRY